MLAVDGPTVVLFEGGWSTRSDITAIPVPVPVFFFGGDFLPRQ